MNRWSLKHHIQKLKSRDDRFFYGLAISCIIDVVLAAFYFLQTFGFNGGLWRFSNTVYYILLLAGKVNLLVLGRREECLGNACKIAGILLILTGVFAMGRTYQYVKMEKVLFFSQSIYILNGIILILRMLIQPMLRAFPKKRNLGEFDSVTNLLGAVRRGYTWAENLIAFSLLFTNLIVLYEWEKDEALLLSNILQGQAIGLIILGIGISLLRKSNKVREAEHKSH